MRPEKTPVTLQRAMNAIFFSVKWQSVLVYLDDIVVFSKNANSHMVLLEQALALLRDAGVLLKLKKCPFFVEKINYLRKVIRPGLLKLYETTTAAVLELRDPATQTELRSFLGLCNVFSQFFSNFSRVAAPLNKKLRKNSPRHFLPLLRPKRTQWNTSRHY